MVAAAVTADAEPHRFSLRPPTAEGGLADPGTVTEALSALADSADVAARRRGALWLARSGTMREIPALVQALRDPDAVVRGFAESAMWQIWSRSGDAETDRLFAVGVEQMERRDGPGAIATFTRVIERQPDFAEGWNKRATVYFLLGEHRKSLADCEEVLKRNPYHFGALSGTGLNYVELDQLGPALEYFERALRVNPNMHQVERNIETLKQLLVERRRRSL
jgi:tetratricopeptide (TPR) repeat protein